MVELLSDYYLNSYRLSKKRTLDMIEALIPPRLDGFNPTRDRRDLFSNSTTQPLNYLTISKVFDWVLEGWMLISFDLDGNYYLQFTYR